MRRLRTCPLGHLQGNGQSCFPYLPREQHAKLTASAGVTIVTATPRREVRFLDDRQCRAAPAPSRDQRGPVTSLGRVRPPVSGLTGTKKTAIEAVGRTLLSDNPPHFFVDSARSHFPSKK
jgi:hypothetical protein